MYQNKAANVATALGGQVHRTRREGYMGDNAAEVLETVEVLLSSVRKLEGLYPDRSFTLDGHLVGSIGEVLAAELYGLQLLPSSAERHDAVDPKGRNVQVKLTQAARVSMYSEPDFLLVLGLDKESGRLEEIYNGPGGPAWSATGKRQKNGQCSVAVSRIRDLNDAVRDEDKLARVRTPEWLETS